MQDMVVSRQPDVTGQLKSDGSAAFSELGPGAYAPPAATAGAVEQTQVLIAFITRMFIAVVPIAGIAAIRILAREEHRFGWLENEFGRNPFCLV